MTQDSIDTPRRRTSDGFTISKAVQVLTLTTLAAAVGYNFHQVVETQQWQEKYDKEYVRRDVQEQELKSINYQLNELRAQITDLKNLVSTAEQRRR